MSVLSRGQTDYIIKTPEQLDCSQVGDSYSELRITALANQSNFWTDIRRALYTGRDFTVLVRAIGDSTETGPRSLPLLDVMKSINGDAFNQFIEAINNMSSMNIGSSEDLQNTDVQLCKEALRLYGYKVLSYAHKKTVIRKKLLDKFVNSLHIDNCDLSEQIVYFDKVSTFIEDKFDITTKEVLKVKYRSEARNGAGVTLPANSLQGEQNSLRKSETKSEPERKQRYLDVELVAMYW